MIILTESLKPQATFESNQSKEKTSQSKSSKAITVLSVKQSHQTTRSRLSKIGRKNSQPETQWEPKNLDLFPVEIQKPNS